MTRNNVSSTEEELLQLDEDELCAAIEEFGKPPRMETIFESCEDDVVAVEADEKLMVVVSTQQQKHQQQQQQPQRCPSRLALQQNVQVWCETTGLPATIRVHVKERSFDLHELPLVSRSGYFKRVLQETKEVQLGVDFPGGAEVFAIVGSFCYGETILVEPGNVALLRCAAEYLEMGEEFGKGNLCELSDMYLRKVALQGWDGTLAVLKNIENLLPMAEELLIVSRCIDSLAFIACSQVLEEEEDDWWWLEPLLELPYGFFMRIIAAIRRQGMHERHIARVVMRFADRWIFTKDCKSDYVWCQNLEQLSLRSDKCRLLESVVRLLPLEKRAAPVSFLFSLLRYALGLGASTDCRVQLEGRIASQLELASLEDFVLSLKEGRTSKAHVESLKQIVGIFIQQQQQQQQQQEQRQQHRYDSLFEDEASFSNLQAVMAVSRVWDCYLEELAYEPGINPTTFSDLVEAIPSCARTSHDQLYKSIHIYLKAHPHVTHPERVMVCKALNCQKLSQEACIHAVQNELMPLRTIVQAMFMEQLQSRTASPGGEEPCKDIRVESAPKRSSSHRFHREQLATVDNCSSAAVPENLTLAQGASDGDVEDAKVRLKQLEQELARVKKSLQNGTSSIKTLSTGGSCIGHIFHQRTGINFGHRLLKTLKRLGLGSLWKNRYNACYEASASVTSTEEFYPSSTGHPIAPAPPLEEMQQRSAAPSPQHRSSYAKNNTSENVSSSSTVKRLHQQQQQQQQRRHHRSHSVS